MRIVVTSNDAGHRIDVIISKYTNYTRSQIKGKIKEVFVNGKPKHFGYKAKEGEIIEFDDIIPEVCDITPEPIELKVLYKDDDIAVIEKPYNMVVHPAPGHWSGTLVNALLYNLKDKLSFMGGYTRPGIVHRLDKETSGLMVIAIHDKAHAILSSLFKSKKVYKEYWAIVNGKVEEKNFTVDKPIGRNPKNRLKMAIVHDGKPAITEFELLATNGKYSLVKARPITGRTHQIRVHLKSVGHPIVGDTTYNPQANKQIKEFNLPESFIPLVAKKISFPHPSRDEIMFFEIDLPKEFKELMEKLSLEFVP